jgi:hypothetical protein
MSIGKRLRCMPANLEFRVKMTVGKCPPSLSLRAHAPYSESNSGLQKHLFSNFGHGNITSGKLRKSGIDGAFRYKPRHEKKIKKQINIIDIKRQKE